MCRSKSEGGRICPGSQKMNTARRQVARLTAELSDDSLDAERRAKLTGKLHRDLKRLNEEAYKHSAVLVPEHLLKSGEDFHQDDRTWAFCSPGGAEFNEAKVTPVVNREYAKKVGYHYLDAIERGWENYLEERDGGPPGKPAGGIWLSPVGVDGVTEWEHLLGNAPEWDEGTQKWSRGGRYNATLSNDARVLHIDTLEDYYAAVDACHREVPSDGDGEPVKGLDYSRLNVDAVYISQRASKGSAFGDEKRDGYEKLGFWDIDSVVVLRPQSVEMTDASGPLISPSEPREQYEAHIATGVANDMTNYQTQSSSDESNDSEAWGGDDWKDDLDDFGDDSSSDYEDEESIDALMAKLGIGGDDDFDDDDDFSDDRRWD